MSKSKGSTTPPAGEGTEKVKRVRKSQDARVEMLKKQISKLPLAVRLQLASDIKSESEASVDAELAAIDAKKEALLAFKAAS